MPQLNGLRQALRDKRIDAHQRTVSRAGALV
jgi:hypothetical protein